MDKNVPGGLLHKDIAQIEVNGTSYPLTVSGGNFVKPDNVHFITAAMQLTGYDVPPTGAWVLYYDTGIVVGSPYQPYAVKLKDEKGLVSETLNTGTARPPLSAETVTIARGQQGAGSGTGDTQGAPIIINGETSAPEAQIKIEHITSGTTVHCTVQEVVSGSATGAVSPYDGNPVNVPLGLGTANEKLYEVKYHTDGEGYTQTSTTTKYYKVLKCHSVTFDANGGTFTVGSTTSTSRTVLVPHNTQAAAPSGTDVPARAGYTLGDWYTEAACTTQWNFATTPITEDKQLYAKWTANTYTVRFHKNDGSGTTANQNFTYGTSNNLTANTFTRIGYTFDGWAENSDGSGTQYADGQSVNNLTTVQGGTVSLYAKWTANTYTVRFNGNGNTGGAAMSDRTFTYDAAGNLPLNTFTKIGYIFGGWATSSGTTTVVRTDGAAANNLAESGTVDLYAVWYKNPTVTFKVEGGTGGSLKGTYGGIPKTAGGTTEQSFTVTYGGSINFETTPTYAWEVEHWTGLTASPANAATVTFSDITQDTIVKVKFKKTTTVKSTDPQPWKLLKEVIKIADNNAVITINGEIEATSGDNAGELKTYLPSSGRLTIQGGTTDAALNAKSQNRIFKIDNDNTLNLKNLTLKNGKASGSGENANGGALYIGPNVPTINLTQVTLTDNTASGNGGAIYIDNARVNLTKVTLTNNTANGDGGAIYNTRCELKIKGSTIENNTAANYGGSIYTKHATITIIDNEGTQKTAIKLNKAKYGAGLCYINCANNEIKGNTEITENGNNTVTEEGGAIYMSSTVASAVRVSISGNTKITNCKAKKGGAVYMSGDISFFIRGNTEIKNCTANAGGGAYVHSIKTSGWGFNIEQAAKFTVSTGGDANKIGKNDVYLNSGCMISANSLTTGNGQAARISIDSGAYSTGTKVLDRGVDAHKKFIVTPQTGSGSNWYVGSDGKLTPTKPW